MFLGQWQITGVRVSRKMHVFQVSVCVTRTNKLYVKASDTVYLSLARASITKSHRLGGCHNRNLLSHRFEGQEHKNEVSSCDGFF